MEATGRGGGGAGDWPVDIAPLRVPEPTLAEAVALADAAHRALAVGDDVDGGARCLEALGLLGRRLPDLLDLELAPGPLDAHDVAVVVADLLDTALGRPSTLLATYGTLRPGQPNHGLLADLGGTWRPGVLHGEVVDWEGYPVLRWQRGGPPVAADVLRADALVSAWDRLDRFEGPRYRRRPVLVQVGGPPGDGDREVGAGTADPDAGWLVATAYVDADPAEGAVARPAASADRAGPRAT